MKKLRPPAGPRATYSGPWSDLRSTLWLPHYHPDGVDGGGGDGGGGGHDNGSAVVVVVLTFNRSFYPVRSSSGVRIESSSQRGVCQLFFLADHRKSLNRTSETNNNAIR